eukprot:gene18415-24119_t
MPIISDVKDGVIDKWNKKEGDQFKAGETLCIVTLDGLTVSVDGPVAGVLSQILVKEGVHVVAGSTLAYFAHTKEEYLEYRENLRLEDHDLELLNDIHEINEIISQKPDNKILLREIKILIQQGDIEDNSEFSKKLQSLARKSDSQLLSVFEASFDGKYDRFLQIADWGGISNNPFYTPSQLSTAIGMKHKADELNMQFVVALGDNFYDNGISGTCFDPRES